MFKAIIVEDEPIERKALSMIITKHVDHVEIVGEAENGRQAIQLAEQLQPDFMLIDIKMPGINGIEAVKRIKKMNPDIKFIMVTAFDTFEYARQLMQQGVREYLLKPSTKDDIILSIQRVLNEIKEEREKDEQHLSTLNKYEQVLSFVQSEWVISLLLDHIQEKHIEELEDLFELPTQVGYAVVISFLNSEIKWSRKEKIELYTWLKQMLKEWQMECYVGPMSGSQVPMFVMDDQVQQAHLMQELRNAPYACRKQFPGCDMRIGIGLRRDSLHDLVHSYHEALTALHHTSERRKTVLFSDSLLKESETTDPYNEEKKLLIAVKNGQVNAAVQLFEQYFSVVVQRADNEINAVRQSIDELFIFIARMMKDLGMTIRNLNRFEQIDSVQQLKEQALLQLEHMIREMNGLGHTIEGNVFHDAKRYIREHYHQAITLEEVADHVGLSPYYFSKFFKEKASMTFIDYLTHIHIEKAKHLVADDSYSLKEICFNVGYKDPNYFSQVFKKKTGLSPSEFRKGSQT